MNVDPKLMEVAMDGITKLGFGAKVRLLRHAADMGELHSCLREYVFGSDNKTANFIKQCQDTVKLAQVADGQPVAKP